MAAESRQCRGQIFAIKVKSPCLVTPPSMMAVALRPKQAYRISAIVAVPRCQ